MYEAQQKRDSARMVVAYHAKSVSKLETLIIRPSQEGSSHFLDLSASVLFQLTNIRLVYPKRKCRYGQAFRRASICAWNSK